MYPPDHHPGAPRAPRFTAPRAAHRRIRAEDRIWLVFGTILLVVGGLLFFRYLAVAELAGGCCGGGLLLVAGAILLVIGVRDRGEFSR
jgi:uncharacterized membrane protein HdeD (DUF308 family)